MNKKREVKYLKTIATCSPKEFLVQTNKIRKSVSKWLSLTKILEIRKNVPKFAENATEEERRKAVSAQMQRNLSEMLDKALEEYPDETAELLGLVCFVDPEDLENHSMLEILGTVGELLENPEVIGFFTSLAKLGQKNTSGFAKA